MRPRPCLNQCVLAFMESVLTPDSLVLEFGAGYSTHWFANRCARVTTLEPHTLWVRIVALWGKGVTVIQTGVASDAPLGRLDLVLVDGLDRVEACREGWKRLKPGGWLVLDDSQRPEYREAHGFLDSAARTALMMYQDPEHDIPEAAHREATAWQSPGASGKLTLEEYDLVAKFFRAMKRHCLETTAAT